MTLEVLLPHWGAVSLLEQAVGSVLAQQADDWRLTIVDDATPGPEVEAYAATLTDPRVRFVKNAENLGVNGNFSRCLEVATEEFVVFLGNDDLLHPNFVEIALEAMATFPEAVVVQPGVQVIGEDGLPTSTLADTVKQKWAMPRGEGRRLLSGEALAASLLRADWMYWPSLVFRREAIQGIGFRADLPLILDLAVVIDLLAAGGSMVVDPRVCFSYRRHDESESSVALHDGVRFAGERDYFHAAAAEMTALGWPRAARAARWHLTSRLHALALMPGALRRRDGAAVRMLLRHAFSSPFARS